MEMRVAVQMSRLAVQLDFLLDVNSRKEVIYQASRGVHHGNESCSTFMRNVQNIANLS